MQDNTAEMEAKRKESPSVANDDGTLRKRKKYFCKHEGSNIVINGGACFRSKQKRCSHEGCTNGALKGGVCWRHGAKKAMLTIRCSHKGCTKHVVNGGVCVGHGARSTKKYKYTYSAPRKRKKRICKHEGCTKTVINSGVCTRHGAKIKTCSHEGCTNNVQKGGVCIRHGAVVKRCIHEGCTSFPKKGGFCKRHAANNNVKRCNQEGCNFYTQGERFCRHHGGNSHYHTGSTIRPSDASLQHIHAMPPSIQRKLVSKGMRVKVRFDGNIWYGGVIARVVKNGSAININYNDGTQEVSEFPDRDVIVDDVGNGRHDVDATAFNPEAVLLCKPTSQEALISNVTTVVALKKDADADADADADTDNENWECDGRTYNEVGKKEEDEDTDNEQWYIRKEEDESTDDEGWKSNPSSTMAFKNEED